MKIEAVEDLLHESDRAVILVITSELDDSLKTLLECFFNMGNRSVKIKSDDLFGPLAPLYTISSKIKIAYAFGLIDSHTYADLELIRGLRNKAAHNRSHINFVQKTVKISVEKLHCTAQFQVGKKV